MIEGIKEMFDPIPSMIKVFKSYTQDFANAALKWLEVYLIEPSSLKQGYLAEAHEWIYPIAISIASLLMAYNYLKLLLQGLGDYQRRKGSEIMVKTLMGVTAAVGAPYVMTEVLLKINNAYVQIVLNQGVDIDRIFKLMLFPSTSSLATSTAALSMALVFLVLACQYIIRQAELAMLFVGAPIAGITIVNEEMNLMPAWWREVVSTIFTQSVHMTGLWIILNNIGNGQTLNDYILAIGMSILMIKGPKWLRTFIYSTGAGAGVVGAAGSVGKMAVYKWAANRVIRPGK